MIWSVVGYVRINFSGENLHTFLDEMKKNGIELKNIRMGKNEVFADIAGNRWKEALEISKNNAISLRVIGRFGLAMKIFVYRNRIAFFLSALIFVIFFLLNSFFVKDINITGNKYLTDNQIKTMLSECGLSTGNLTFAVKPKDLQTKMMKKCDRLSWIWIDMKGTTANVDVREKVSKPDFYDKSYACNIVAKRDGVITNAIGMSGTVYAQVGSYVKKGELLVGGVIDSNEFAPVRFVRASGKVIAKTNYSLSDRFNSAYKKYSKGEKLYEFTLTLFGYRLRFGNADGKNVIMEKSETKNFQIFGKKYSGLGFTKTKYCEIIEKEYTLDMENTEKLAVKELNERLTSKLEPGVEIVNSERVLSKADDGTMTVTVNFECVEDIAEEKVIFVSEE